MSPADDGDGITVLRDLLVGPERAELVRLEKKLEDPDHQVRKLSQHLPNAVRRAAEQSPELSDAMIVPVEQALERSRDRAPERLASLLFPVILPAIRQAISAQLRATFDGLNQLLERSFTLQGLKWRWRAWRTGRPIAEVALLDNLVFRVEQALLIHAENGLLLAHAEVKDGDGRDADLVSGMLTAIQDFVQDSFPVHDGARLDTLRVGDLAVWIVRAPGLILAAAIRGTAPAALRQRLEATAEQLARRHASDLTAFGGDTSPFAASLGTLRDCLEHHERERPPRRIASIFLGALALGALALAFWPRPSDPLVELERRLRAEPGLILLEREPREHGYLWRGLKDPLARDPQLTWEQLCAGPGGPQERRQPCPPVEWALREFYSLDPGLVERRAQLLLQPPPSVKLRLDGRRLVATGTSTHDFWVRARARGPLLPGVEAWDDSGLVDVDQQALKEALRGLVGARVEFDLGQPEPNKLEQVEVLRTRLLAVEAGARRLGQALTLPLVGRTDESGSEGTNRELSRRRAERVHAILAQSDFRNLHLMAIGRAASEETRRPSGRFVEADAEGVLGL